MHVIITPQFDIFSLVQIPTNLDIKSKVWFFSKTILRFNFVFAKGVCVCVSGKYIYS